MNQEQLRQRTMAFAVRIVKLVTALPKNRTGDVLGRQLLRSGTSIGANYREAIRASSKRHFVTTLEIVQRETDETMYWLELLVETDTMSQTKMAGLIQECKELMAIFTAAIKTAKARS